MIVGKTELKLLKSLFNYSSGASEQMLRKSVKRKSPVYKELNTLHKKGLIIKKAGKSFKMGRGNYYTITTYGISQKGSNYLVKSKGKLNNNEIMNLIKEITEISKEDHDIDVSEGAFTPEEERRLMSIVKQTTKFRNKDTSKFMTLINKHNLDAENIYDVGLAWELRKDGDDDLAEEQQEDLYDLSLNNKDFWFVGKMANKFNLHNVEKEDILW